MDSSERLRLSLLCSALFSFGWLILGWVTWVFQGCKPIMPFISDLDLYEPGDTIFTFGVMGSSLLVTWFLFEIHAFRHKVILDNNYGSFWFALNYVALVPGILAAIGCLKIGNTPWNENVAAHGAYALDIFYGGVIWCILVTILTFKLLHGHPSFIKLISLRATTSLLALVSLWQMLVTVGKVWNKDFDGDSWSALTNNMQDFCTNNLYPLLTKGALWEWLLIGSILATILTFIPEINLLKLETELEE